MSALSGRELFASIRNTYIKDNLLEPEEIASSKWWTLHEKLELDHFQSAIRPVIKSYVDNHIALDSLLETMKEEIDRHVQYWDTLWEDAVNTAK